MAAAATRVFRLRTVGFGSKYTLKLKTMREGAAIAATLRASNQTFEAEQVEACADLSSDADVNATSGTDLTPPPSLPRWKPRACKIFLEERFGTAFVLQSEDRLATSLHVIAPGIIEAFRAFPISRSWSRLLPHFQQSRIYMDTRGVQGQRRTPGDLRVLELNANPVLFSDGSEASFEGNFFTELSDLVLLKSQLSDVEPLELATEMPQPGETLYAMGYIGLRLELSRGPLRSADQFLSSMNQKEPAKLRALRDRLLIYGEFSCKPGTSGGPIFNGDGLVIGMIGGEYTERKTGAKLCWGVNLVRFAELREFWQKTNPQPN